MSFKKEPPFVHGQEKNPLARSAILLCNLGTPDAPTASALRRYLREFLSDSRVVEIPKPIWWLILNAFILPFRPAKSAAKYKSIWMNEPGATGSPLKVWSMANAAALEKQLRTQGHQISVRLAMRYGQPGIGQELDKLKAEGCQRVLVLPLYPQYSATTTASVIDAVSHWQLKTRSVPELRFVNRYHDHPAYINALAQRIESHWAQYGRGDKLVMSFHGVPERTLLLGDMYHCECHKTARLLGEKLGLTKEQYQLTFQSRFGKAKWLEPYTEPTLIALAKSGLKNVDVVCPGFPVDCLETLEEISQEASEAFLHAGGKQFNYIPCLNDFAPWIDALAQVAAQHLLGWPTLQAQDAQAMAVQAARYTEVSQSTGLREPA
jgi:protoporphyrin/coproporphyrin ferrochelatase